MNLTVPGLCTHPNIFMARNNLNHVSGRDSLWYMTSNLCDLLMDKDPITQYETNFFECLCFSCKWKRFCSRERLEWPSPHDCTSSVWDELVFIPVIEPPAVRKVESKKFSAHPSTVNFFFTWYHPYSPNYPIYPPTLLILQWQNLYLFLTKLIILGKIYISSWLNFSNYILF